MAVVSSIREKEEEEEEEEEDDDSIGGKKESRQRDEGRRRAPRGPSGFVRNLRPPTAKKRERERELTVPYIRAESLTHLQAHPPA